MKFAHIGDSHLGGWRQPELKNLNFEYFREAINRCIKKKVDFILIAGDLFDSPYPPIDTLKDTFQAFKKIKDAKIPVFLIAGSHDYSVSGKTFLEVLEKAGFCKNVSSYEEKNDKIMLYPTIHENVAIYGYPGKKSGLEVDNVSKIKIQDAPGLFKILMLHTTIRDAIGTVPIKSVDETKLPVVDYLALAHLHINYQKGNSAYCGPTFPNNLSELEKLRAGSFYIFNEGRLEKEIIKLKEILPIHLEITDALRATEDILASIDSEEIRDKIVIIRLSGTLEKGKITDIDFPKIEAHLKEKGAYTFLKSMSKLHISEEETQTIESSTENIEAQLIKKFEEKNKTKFNVYLIPLLRSLQIEKLEDETNSTFEERLLSETNKVLKI